MSLLSLSQMIELNFSGSSVASGASTSAMRPAGMPMVSEMCPTASTKMWAAKPITATDPTTCAVTAQVGAGGRKGQRVRLSGGSPSVASFPHGPVSHVQALAHQLDRVREQDSGTEYRRQREQQFDYGHWPPPTFGDLDVLDSYPLIPYYNRAWRT